MPANLFFRMWLAENSVRMKENELEILSSPNDDE